MAKFNIDREDLYRYHEPKERTKKRLTQIAQLGIEEVGRAEFGFKGLVSGLYIEKVWNYSDEEWDKYMEWVNIFCEHKTTSKITKP